MEPIIAHEPRWLLFVPAICLVPPVLLFQPMYLQVKAVEGFDLMAVLATCIIFAPWLLLGLWLLVDILVRRLVIEGEEYLYVNAIGLRRRFTRQDIAEVQHMSSWGTACMRVLDHNGKRLAQVDYNMVGAALVWKHLMELPVPSTIKFGFKEGVSFDGTRRQANEKL